MKKLNRRIKWNNVVLVVALLGVVILSAMASSGVTNTKVLTEKLKYSQQQEERLHLEVKKLDEEVSELMSDNFKLRLELSNTQGDVEELKAQLDNN